MLRTIICLILVWTAAPAFGFALLGPYASWMTPTNGYNHPLDRTELGGPMALGEEYRWNLPVITYGFDRDFVGYFGKRGVEEVEKAIAVLTNLPAASKIDVNVFSNHTYEINVWARSLGLLDLKSFALQQLLYQLGLTKPCQHIWNIRDRTNGPDPFILIVRNFDPVSLAETDVVNGVQYGYQIVQRADGSGALAEFPLDPLADNAFDAVAEGYFEAGRFHSDLTADDAGGLRYLYSKHNLNVETLHPHRPTCGHHCAATGD